MSSSRGVFFPDEDEYYRHKIRRNNRGHAVSAPAPAAPRTPFHLFLCETRERLRAEGCLRTMDSLREDAGMAWDALEDWQKEPYRKQAE